MKIVETRAMYLVSLLRDYLSSGSGETEVMFKKANGETRIMRCTLNHSLIDARLEEKNKNAKKTTNNEFKEERPPNLEVMRVFDLEIDEFRSFRIDSLIWVGKQYVYEFVQSDLESHFIHK